MDNTKDYTLRDIDEGLDKLALIIEAYGEKYLPLFEYLHEEREKMLSQNTSLQLALNRAKKLHQIATQNNTQLRPH